MFFNTDVINDLETHMFESHTCVSAGICTKAALHILGKIMS